MASVYAFLTLTPAVFTESGRATSRRHLRWTGNALKSARRAYFSPNAAGAHLRILANLGWDAVAPKPRAARYIRRRAPIAQLEQAADPKSAQCRLESDWGHTLSGRASGVSPMVAEQWLAIKRGAERKPEMVAGYRSVPPSNCCAVQHDSEYGAVDW